MFMRPRNWFQGMNSASLAGRYDNPIPTRCLAPTDFLKISSSVRYQLWQKHFLLKQLIQKSVKRGRRGMYLYLYSMQYLCHTCHILFSGGNIIQKIYLPVKVSSPDGNFDTLVRIYLAILRISKSKFWFWHIYLDFIRPGNFLRGAHVTKIWSKGKFFMKTLLKLGGLIA